MDMAQDVFLEKLFREYYRELTIHAYCLLDDWNMAHEAAQETFHIACEKTDDLMNSPNPIGWLKNTAKNVVRNMIRARERQARLLRSFEELHTDDIRFSYQMRSRFRIGDLKGHITDEDLFLLRRIFIDGISYKDASKELGIKMWACRKRVQRLLEQLRKILNEI